MRLFEDNQFRVIHKRREHKSVYVIPILCWRPEYLLLLVRSETETEYTKTDQKRRHQQTIPGEISNLHNLQTPSVSYQLLSTACKQRNRSKRWLFSFALPYHTIRYRTISWDQIQPTKVSAYTYTQYQHEYLNIVTLPLIKAVLWLLTAGGVFDTQLAFMVIVNALFHFQPLDVFNRGKFKNGNYVTESVKIATIQKFLYLMKTIKKLDTNLL